MECVKNTHEWVILFERTTLPPPPKKKKYHASFIPVAYLHLGQQTSLT